MVAPGEDAGWSVNIVNHNDAPLIGVTVRLHAIANGTTPLTFATARMPGCVADTGDSELCTLPNIPSGAAAEFNAYAGTSGLADGATVAGDVTVSADGVSDGTGVLASVAIVAPAPAARGCHPSAGLR